MCQRRMVHCVAWAENDCLWRLFVFFKCSPHGARVQGGLDSPGTRRTRENYTGLQIIRRNWFLRSAVTMSMRQVPLGILSCTEASDTQTQKKSLEDSTYEESNRTKTRGKKTFMESMYNERK